MYKTLIFFNLGFFISTYGYESLLQVTTNQGVLQGKFWTTITGRSFIGFTGIPYAKPPVAELRFKPPIPIKGWEEKLDATKNTHNVCSQPGADKNTVIGSENCLFLNIYKPFVPNKNKHVSFPVMFYIHGGTFLLGSASPDWLGPEILLDKPVILVTVNYRLGSLGFLSTGDKIVAGNNGLKDISLALKWIKENIIYFNGDPDQITVWGNSAGGAAAHLLSLSPLTRSLISKIIIQSGSAVATFSVISPNSAKENAMKLGESLNCPKNSTRNLLSCLKKIDSNEIVKAESRMTWERTQTVVPFLPVIETSSQDAFLTKYPIEIIKSGEAADIPMIAGVVAQEGGYKAADLIVNSTSLAVLNNFFHVIIPEYFHIISDKVNKSKAIRKFYFGNNTINDSHKTELTKMYSDGWFIYPVDEAVRLHFKYLNQLTYQYLFDYRGSVSVCNYYDPNHNYGVCHTDELLYLLTRKRTFPNYEPSKSDREMIDLMTTLWTNFAITGKPTPSRKSYESFEWKPVQSSNTEYLHIRNYSDISMSSNLYEERMLFWKSLLL